MREADDWDNAPARPKRQILERDVQKASVAYFRRMCPNGYARKFRSPANPSVPDYIFTAPGLDTWYVEVKAPGKKPTEAQRAEHEKIRRADGAVWVIDDLLDFCVQLQDRLRRVTAV